MSGDRFKQYNYNYEQGYTAIANKIFKDKRLTPLSRFILMYYFSNSATWEVLTPVASRDLGINQSTFIRHNRELYEKGYITRERQRKENGNLGAWDYQYSYDPVFKNPPWEQSIKPPKKQVSSSSNTPKKTEKQGKVSPGRLSPQGVQPSPQLPPIDNQPIESATLPMPNKPMPNKQALDKALPTSSKNPSALGKAAPKSKSRQFKRTPDKEDLFEYVKSLEFGPKKEKLSEDTASYISHAYTRKQIEDCYFDVQGKIMRKQNIKKPIGLFRTLLDSEHCPRGKNCDTNEAFARKLRDDLQMSTLVIKDKFVYDINISGKELSLNMSPSEFRHSLENLYSGY